MVGATAGPRQPVRMTAWAACLALLLAAVQAGVAEARTFRAADIQAEDYPTVQALMHLDKLLQERTNGRHRLQIFHSRQLGEEKETIEQTRAGAIDLNRINVAPIASFAPEANVLVLPFLFRSVDHLHRVLDGAIGNDILKSFDASGFVGLTFYDSGARSIYNSVRPIRKLEDLKGLRIRIQQSDLMTDMFKALGVTPVPLPYGQVMTGLSTQLIDGAENNWPSFVTTGHYRAAPYYSLDPAHDGARGARHVREGMGQPLARGPGDLPRGGARIQRLHARAVAGLGGALAPRGPARRRHHRRGR